MIDTYIYTYNLNIIYYDNFKNIYPFSFNLTNEDKNKLYNNGKIDFIEFIKKEKYFKYYINKINNINIYK